MADPFVFVAVPDPMIGRVVDRFVVIAPLGRGGMGTVYLAHHEASPAVRCVIKTMLAHVANNPLLSSRFRTETEAVARLRHDNIVRLESFGALDDGQNFMRFEFVDGKPLDRYVAEHGGRLSLHRAAYLAFQVCDALDHAHAAGVVHRDLKPDNLLIVADPAARVPQLVKVVDFGISKVSRPGEIQTGSGLAMGTPGFMAAEQYANAAEATARADVFSLAVIVWQMLTGELPWGRPDPSVLYHLQRTVVPEAPQADIMSAAVAAVLLRGFAVEPGARPTMREFAVALAAAIPATDRAPSGTEMLLDLVPRWAAIHTARRAEPATINERRRAAASPSRHAAAGLATGYASGELATAAPGYAPVASVASIVAASEFVVPAPGTRGAQAYAHAQLPAVVVSSQIALATVDGAADHTASAPGQRGRRLLIGAAVGVLTASLSFLIVYLGSRPDPVQTDPADPAHLAPRAAAAPAPRVVEPRVVEPARGGAESAVEPSARSVSASDAAIAAPNAGASPKIDRAPAPPSAPAHRPRAPVAPAAAPSAPVPATAPVEVAAPVPRRDGELVITVQPWAAIWVNGRAVPDGTPYRMQVPAGRYRVRLVNDDLAQSENLTVTVEPRQTTLIERKW